MEKKKREDDPEEYNPSFKPDISKSQKTMNRSKQSYLTISQATKKVEKDSNQVLNYYLKKSNMGSVATKKDSGEAQESKMSQPQGNE